MTGHKVSIAALVSMLLTTLSVPGLASAGMRCGDKIIDKGSSSYEVTSLCGPPSQVERTTEFRGTASTVDSNGRVTRAGSDVQVEYWTYNFGPNSLMERLRIEDGVVVDIQVLGYGFDAP